MPDEAELWDRWKQLEQIQRQRLQLQSQLQTQAVQRWKSAAEATGAWLTQSKRRNAMRRMNRELYRIERTERLQVRRARTASLAAMRCRTIYRLHTATKTERMRMWSGWYMLFNTAVDYVAIQELNAIELTREMFEASSYVGRTMPLANQRFIVGWLDTLKKEDAIPRPTNLSYSILLKCFELIGQAAGRLVHAESARIAELKSQTNELWSPASHVN